MVKYKVMTTIDCVAYLVPLVEPQVEKVDDLVQNQFSPASSRPAPSLTVR